MYLKIFRKSKAFIYDNLFFVDSLQIMYLCKSFWRLSCFTLWSFQATNYVYC